MRVSLLPFAVLVFTAFAGAQQVVEPARCERARPEVVARLRADIAWLADDARAGREPGTEGARATEDWLVRRFAALGLQPAGEEGYRQPFRVAYGVEETARSQVILRRGDETRVLALGVDFRVVHVPHESGDGRAVGPLVYVGHALASRDADWNDFRRRGERVRGRIAVALAGPPRPSDPLRAEALRRARVTGSLFGKVRAARQAGAVAFIEIALDDDGLAGGYVAPPAEGIPVVRVSRAVGAWLLGREVDSLGPETMETMPVRIPSATGRVVASTRPRQVMASNVLGLARGTFSAGEVFVVGAHQDHVGYGGPTSLLPGIHAVHNGADDNASGTAVVLELARRIVRMPLRRDVVFALFGAEELGLVGSRWLVAHRPPALRAIAAVMNLDMVGRLRDCRLFVESRETAPVFGAAVEFANRAFGFDARPWEPSRGAWGASDHMSFIEARVPGIFLFTGLHDDYHRPEDDVSAINHRGLAAVADFAEALLRRVDELAARDRDALRFVGR
jgi:hypothetical protein